MKKMWWMNGKTDFERMKTLLDEMGVGYQVYSDAGTVAIIFKPGMEKVIGHTGLYSGYNFDNGKLINAFAWE